MIITSHTTTTTTIGMIPLKGHRFRVATRNIVVGNQLSGVGVVHGTVSDIVKAIYEEF